MQYAVAVSGSGTILESMLLDGLHPDLVIADRACPGIEIAQSAGVTTTIIDRKKFGYVNPQTEWDRKGFTAAATSELRGRGIKLLVMAGFMTIWSPGIFKRIKVLNTHPALLPKYKGATAVADTLAAGETESGCTIHIATEILDDERFFLAQAKVPVLPDDDVDSLWERIKQQERKLYPQVLCKILDGQIDLEKVMRGAD